MTPDNSATLLRILLVEDNKQDQAAFERALKASGLPFELIVRRRAEDIVPAVESGGDAFDVVVLDCDLPGQNGPETYRALQGESHLPPFVMLIGAGSESLAVEALKAGMYDYIIKDPNRAYLRLMPLLNLMNVKQRHRDRLARLEAETELKKVRAALEQTVKLRTIDLARTVEALQDEINERRQAERALMRSERALRSLSLKIVETQENERRLLSKELHDSIGGSLAAIKFALEEKLQHMQGEPPDSVVSLEKVIGYVLDTIKEVRRISTSLRPSMLDDLGLLATARWFCRNSGEMYAATRIETKFDLAEEDIPEIYKIVVYRVMQEALSNALKHSGAETVRVSLENTDDCIRMCVEDDGIGFDRNKKTASDDPLTGYGLQGMSDRAEVVGGLLSIESSPGMGTSVCMELPAEFEPEAIEETITHDHD